MIDEIKKCLPSGYHVYERSIQKAGKKTFAMVENPKHEKFLYVSGEQPIELQKGKRIDKGVLYPLISENAFALSQYLSYLKPRPLGVNGPSFGFGDRLGVATPGHVRSVRSRSITPVFAQQSIRELKRTKRVPEEVMASAMWGVFQEGYKKGFGADADHLKTPEDVEKVVPVGFTMFTCDPSDYVNGRAATMSSEELKREFEDIEDHMGIVNRYGDRKFKAGRLQLEFSEKELMRAVVKYYRAIKHAEKMYQIIESRVKGEFDFELSIDETDEPTTPKQHLFIINELKDAGVKITGIAPRFVGDFQKAIDYIGDLDEFARQLEAHVEIAQTFGPYKISVHSGSDKFSIYPLIKKYCGTLFHVKTAGTSYLEALRLIAGIEPEFFSRIFRFSLERFEEERRSYAMTTDISKIPNVDELPGERLPELLEQNDARQVLHVAYGSVLTTKNENGDYAFKDKLMRILKEHEEEYEELLVKHFARHLDPLSISL